MSTSKCCLLTHIIGLLSPISKLDFYILCIFSFEHFFKTLFQLFFRDFCRKKRECILYINVYYTRLITVLQKSFHSYFSVHTFCKLGKLTGNFLLMMVSVPVLDASVIFLRSLRCFINMGSSSSSAIVEL